MKKINFKNLAFFLFVTLFTGGLTAIITSGSMDIYKRIQKPPLSPPSILFPIVWSVLYILMAVGAYMVYESDCKFKKKALTAFTIQLILNFFWPIIFFNFEAFLLASLWIIALLIYVIIMTINFCKCNKISGILQIPYILWCIFATYLTIAVCILN